MLEHKDRQLLFILLIEITFYIIINNTYWICYINIYWQVESAAPL